MEKGNSSWSSLLLTVMAWILLSSSVQTEVGTQTGALYQPRGVGWGGWAGEGDGREVQEGGDIHIYLWVIHVDV